MLNSRILPALWHSLQDTTWTLNRTLTSTNTSEPAGTCTGTAKFASRKPSTFIDKDGKLQLAAREMLYTEAGSFHMSNILPNAPAFSFSRKYIWRLRDDQVQVPEISIWFTKPGTEEIDYLFHAFLVQHVDQREGTDEAEVSCSGGHLCVEDYYSSSYVFSGRTLDEESNMKIKVYSWTMHHDVRGPKKDQSIETAFTRHIAVVGEG